MICPIFGEDDELLNMRSQWEPTDKASHVPLLCGSSLPVLACVLITLNVCRTHCVSSVFIDALLHVLSESHLIKS